MRHQGPAVVASAATAGSPPGSHAGTAAVAPDTWLEEATVQRDAGSGRTVILRTRRLTLTTWSPGDLADLHRMHSDPETMRFIGGEVETLEESRARLGRYLEEQSARGWTKWRVTDEHGHMVGRAGFGTVEGHRDLGYTYERRAWGRGLATEAARALVAWHVRHPAATGDGTHLPLSGHAQLEHTASQRVLAKAGLRRVEDREMHGLRCAFFVLPAECPTPA